MAPLGPDDDVLCTVTMGFRPFSEFVGAAAAAGFTAISLNGSDYKAARATGLGDADIRAMLADHGLRVAELDAVIDWLAPPPAGADAGFDPDIPFFGHSEADYLAIAEAVGARSTMPPVACGRARARSICPRCLPC